MLSPTETLTVVAIVLTLAIAKLEPLAIGFLIGALIRGMQQ